MTDLSRAERADKPSNVAAEMKYSPGQLVSSTSFDGAGRIKARCEFDDGSVKYLVKYKQQCACAKLREGCSCGVPWLRDPVWMTEWFLEAQISARSETT